MYRLLAFALLGSAAAFKPFDREELKNSMDAFCSGDPTMTTCTAADGTPIADWDVSDVTDIGQLFY